MKSLLGEVLEVVVLALGLYLVITVAVQTVPVSYARALADAGVADLRVITGAGHRLRHDPRVVAVLIGWMEMQEVT